MSVHEDLMIDNSESVLIIDSGSQYFKLIDRIVREQCVRTVVAPLTISPFEISEKKYKAIIISGGPASIVTDASSFIDGGIFDLGIPILGICFGMQLMVKRFGGKVEKLEKCGNAQTVIKIERMSDLFLGLEPCQSVLLTHGDSCTEIPQRFTINAISSSSVVVSISDDKARLYGVQFHPEVNLTTNGKKIFHNFLFDISKCNPTYTKEEKLHSVSTKILKSVLPNSKLIVLVSGGVDSTVCVALLRKYLPNHIIKCFLIDNGFLRKNEANLVKTTLAEIGVDIKVVYAANKFINATTYVANPALGGAIFDETPPLRVLNSPECKRNIIGDTFVSVIEDEIQQLNFNLDECILVQGTLRPDLIESASPSISTSASVIKTHHNDTLSVRKLRKENRLLEPLQDLHKDEVRQLAAMIGLPDKFIDRYPFPGPGLAIRVICGDSLRFVGVDSKFDVSSLAQFIANFAKKNINEPHPVVSAIRESLSLYDCDALIKATSNTYTLNATLLPILSVGIRGDSRTYYNTVVLSSDSINIDWQSLYIIAKIIPKICDSVNRVAFAFGPKIQQPIHAITTTYLTPEVIDLIREADHVVNSILDLSNFKKKISQFPVVLIPIHFDIPSIGSFIPCKRSVVLRPIVSDDFMTCVPAIPGEHIAEEIILRIKDSVMQIPGISRVLYDLSSKPPATVEWE